MRRVADAVPSRLPWTCHMHVMERSVNRQSSIFEVGLRESERKIEKASTIVSLSHVSEYEYL